MSDGLYRVTLPYAVAGIKVMGGKIVEPTAPILQWAVGKTIKWFAYWVRMKHGQLEYLG